MKAKKGLCVTCNNAFKLLKMCVIAHHYRVKMRVIARFYHVKTRVIARFNYVKTRV